MTTPSSNPGYGGVTFTCSECGDQIAVNARAAVCRCGRTQVHDGQIAINNDLPPAEV